MPSRPKFFDSLFDREAMRRRYPHQDTALRAYLQDLGAVSLLTPEQEAKLLAQAANGEASAVSRLVEANLRLVLTIAARFQGRGVAMLDLIQEGNIGLLEAITRFDPSKSTRLSTYAKFWILSSIQRAVASQGTLLHAPFRMGERLQKMKELIATFESQGIEPTPEKIAASLHCSLDHVMELIGLMQKPLDLNHVQLGESDTLAERLAAPPLLLISDVTSLSQFSDVRAIMSRALTQKQRLVIEYRFGLNEEGLVYSYHEIATRFFDRTGSRADEAVRQLERTALARLRAAFDEKET